MFKNKLISFISQIKDLTKKEKLFIVFAMLCGICITAEYAVVRPVSNSVFLQFFRSSSLPYAWLLGVPFNFLVVSFYSRFIAKWGNKRMHLYMALCVMSMHVAATFFLKTSPTFTFFYFIWKDIYVLMMFQLVWSVIHTNMNPQKAKFLYGAMFGIGGIGGMLGSLLPSLFAVKVGSESLLLASLPIYLLMVFFYRKLIQSSERHLPSASPGMPSFFEGFNKVRHSSYLTYILVLVVMMQVASTVVEFQFNHVLEKMIQVKDVRTAYLGKLSGIINMVTVSLQFIGTFFLVQFLGIRRSHLFIPLFCLGNALVYWFFPAFRVGCVLYTCVKSFDFSLFGVLKEMLYVPLKTEDKFSAKAFIDVFVHRSSKALASVLILSVEFIPAIHFMTLLSCTLMGIFLSWSFVVIKMFKSHAVEQQFS